MTVRPVNNTPSIPRPTGHRDLGALARFDADLVKMLFLELSEHARAINQFAAPALPLNSYLVAEVPAAANSPNALIYVSDETGGGVPAFSDGINWRRVTDRAIVS